jgi:hypothetical protein
MMDQKEGIEISERSEHACPSRTQARSNTCINIEKKLDRQNLRRYIPAAPPNKRHTLLPSCTTRNISLRLPDRIRSRVLRPSRRALGRVANTQSCLTELLDLIAILQFNQAKLLSLKTASNPSNIAKID